MRWIAASLLAINALVLIVQLAMPHLATPVDKNSAPQNPALQGDAEAAPLQLLAELDPAAWQALTAGSAGSRQPARLAGEITPPLCTMLGPFEALLEAEYLVERLAALGLASSIQDLETPGDTGYWIYLPPRDSRKQAFDQLRELQAKGIDSYVIPKGELSNGISFGMFSRADLAASRLRDMRSQGYAAELKEITRSHKETWVVLAPGQSGQLDDQSWQRLLDDKEAIERRHNFCPPVASQ